VQYVAMGDGKIMLVEVEVVDDNLKTAVAGK
jgi:hypothetical protein